jgi:uncharacterized protein YbjT (DUF2867 family)
MKKLILVAGGTGNLGGKIVRALVEKGADVRAIVRASSDLEKVNQLKQLGVQVIPLDMSDKVALTQACEGVSCVVSALAGLEDVIVDTQKALLDAAVAAGVPRFIPSDYSLDFTLLPAGGNRNLDFRRVFRTYIDAAPIAATSIFNGAFTDMLTGQMPLVLFNINKILAWGNPDHSMPFTTIADTAVYTAHVALDPSTPRFLRIAGDQRSAREMQAVASEVTGKEYGLLRPGGLGLLGMIIKIARTIAPGKQELYPAWQGMQYMHNMLDERSVLKQIDNDRYAGMQWTTTTDVLTAHLASNDKVS